MKHKKAAIIGAAVLVILIAAAGLLYSIVTPAGQAGAKTIGLTIKHADGTAKELELKTDEAYLRGALEEKRLISGDEGPYGLYLTAVEGESADESKQEWWCITKNNGQLNTSVDLTPIEDGDHFEITFTVGW